MAEQLLAKIEAGVVTALFVVDPADQTTLDVLGGVLVPELLQVEVGWSFDGVNFSKPTTKKTATEKWDEIKAHRDMLTSEGGYLAAGKWFHSDQTSRSQQLGLVLLGSNIPAGLQWKTMDGTFVTMTQTLAGQILAAAAASDTAIFAAAEVHRAAMEASQDPAAYDFSAGWPTTFLG